MDEPYGTYVDDECFVIHDYDDDTDHYTDDGTDDDTSGDTDTDDAEKTMVCRCRESAKLNIFGFIILFDHLSSNFYSFGIFPILRPQF